MKILFLFLDGIGLGENDPARNPFARLEMPTLQALLGGRKMLAANAPYHGGRASLLALDAGLGVPGLPQSATGQAALLTGRNVPAEIGGHYGPKPNRAVAAYLNGDGSTLFHSLIQAGKKATLLNAYPPRYFRGIESGRRLYSAIPLAVTSAGIPLLTRDDLYAGRALSADFTGQGWRTFLGFADAPVMPARAAGQRLAELAREYDFAMFEYWASDYAGHGQDMERACELLETFDGVLGGLVEARDDTQGLILITSDHGNIEDLSTRRHTQNKAACLLIGGSELRQEFARRLQDLTGIRGAVERTIIHSSPPKVLL